MRKHKARHYAKFYAYSYTLQNGEQRGRVYAKRWGSK
jgi:hypothetical protein